MGFTSFFERYRRRRKTVKTFTRFFGRFFRVWYGLCYARERYKRLSRFFHNVEKSSSFYCVRRFLPIPLPVECLFVCLFKGLTMFEYRAGGGLIACYVVPGEIFTRAPQDKDIAIVLVDTGENQVQRYCVSHCESGSLDRYSGRYFETMKDASEYYILRVSALFGGIHHPARHWG